MKRMRMSALSGLLGLLLSILGGVQGQGAKGALPAALPDEVWSVSKVQGGLVVHLGCGLGESTVALLKNERYVVHGLDSSPQDVAKARSLIQSKGLYFFMQVASFHTD